jgi:hypothetical protein
MPRQPKLSVPVQHSFRCWIAYRILLARGYPPAVARAEALRRHPKAFDYYIPPCENTASTKPDANAAPSSRAANPKPSARTADASSVSGGVADAHP